MSNQKYVSQKQVNSFWEIYNYALYLNNTASDDKYFSSSEFAKDKQKLLNNVASLQRVFE